MPSTFRPWQPVGATVYDRLDLTGVRLDKVLTGTRGRAAMLATAQQLGYPARTVTPALTRWSRIYVIQLGGDLDGGTVTLAARDGGTLRLTLPAEFAYRKAPPARLAALLAAVEVDYPPQSLSAGLAECLASVLDVCERARRRAAPCPSRRSRRRCPCRCARSWTPGPNPTTSATKEET